MLSRLEELKLIALCVATDNRDAFGRLVEEYQEPLRRFILNLTGGDPMLTDDIAQETFLKAYMSIRSFKGLAKFKTWLYRIAYNEFISYRRKYGNESDFAPLPDIPPEHSPHTSTEINIDIATCMAQLSDNERTVALLFYLEDLPIKKIEEITGLPKGTITSHLNRARGKLKTIYNPQL